MTTFVTEARDQHTNFLYASHMIFGNYKEDFQKLFLQFISPEKLIYQILQIQILH